MPDQGIAPAEEVISFGPFRLLPARQLLLEGDRPVRVGSRALDILATLLARPGEVVGKDELFARVWPNTFVEEGNLRVHIAALRRALGDGAEGRRFITNVPGRGYSFVAPVTVATRQPEAPSPAPPAARPRNMPVPLARMVGRSDVVSVLREQLPNARFITIVGPGGIGKTTVAVAVADGLLPSFADGVCFVDLAPITDPALVPSALAALLGIGVRSDDPLPSLIGFLRDKRMLVVLDSCEHMIDAAATLAERLVNGTDGTHVLATSREALRAEGERVHRLSELNYPATSAGLTAADAFGFSAVQLFVERASATVAGFALSDGEAPIVADICRRLDGIALAVEIAASWVEAFGVAGLAARLNDRFQLLMRGRRTALARHQTLAATLDWSHAQLSEPERRVLRRLAVFVGVFTLESAAAVLADADSAGEGGIEAIDAIATLTTKSLVSADVGRANPFYRLFDVTRAYAMAKLEESGEKDGLARVHAEHHRLLLERSERDWESRPAADWVERHRHLIDNVRAALDFSFSPAGDQRTGVALTVAAVPLWFQLSLVSECADRLDRALAAPPATRDAAREMRLYAARAWSLMQTRGLVPETEAAWSKVLDLAEQDGDVDYQLRALWGLWAGLQNRSELGPALALAERFSAVASASANPMDVHVGERMVGYILHLMGDQTRARHYLERMIERYEPPVVGAQAIRFVFDQRATAQCFLARILWLQGASDQARRLTTSLVEGAMAGRDVLSLCQVLVQAACPVAFLLGDLAAADRHVRLLLDNSERQALEFWHAYGRCFEAVLAIRRGDVAGGLGMLGAALEELREIQYGVLYGTFLCEYAAALGQAGRYDEGQAAIDQALERSRQNQELWYLPELLRTKGELLLRQGETEAERLLVEALDLSRHQHTLAWELRAATSLARLRQAAGSLLDARAILAPVYARFSEGLETADLASARALLQAWS